LKIYKTSVTTNFNKVTKENTGFVAGCIVTGTANKTVTLTGTVEAYWQGKRIPALVSGWESTAHGTDTAKIYYLYYDGATVAWYDSAWSFEKLQIAYAWYATSLTSWVYQRETHGFMPVDCHESDHFNKGAYRETGAGGDIGSVILNSTTAGDRRPTVSELTIHDEDLETVIAEIANDRYNQFTLTSTGIKSVIFDALDIIPLSTNNPYYNLFTSPNWGQALMPNNSVASVWIIGIPMASDANSQKYRFLFIQPQWITQATGAGAPQLLVALTDELKRNFSEISLGNLTAITNEILPLARIALTYTGSNWVLSSVSNLTGSRYLQSQSPAGNFLSTVTTNTTLTGAGTVASPLGLSGTVFLTDNQTVASSAIAGYLRYYVSGNNSYIDICMQTGASTYAWINIITYGW
jgi:hypothetical protein